MSAELEVAFVGAGNMAAAMVAGLVGPAGRRPEAIACIGGRGDSARLLCERTGIRKLASPRDLPEGGAALVLAIKPQKLPELDPVWQDLAAGRLVVSVLAGTTLATLRRRFPRARALVRAMPNTPGRIAAGVTAVAWEKPPSPRDADAASAILGGLGLLLEVPESQMDAVTGLSGSGPAYVFEFIAALRQAGEAAGLPAATARVLADQTVYGAARLLLESSGDPDALRVQVTSPGGTTAAGLRVLGERDFRGVIRETVLAATQRARELAADAG
jgi:pyrroline-5-carboxylate reductase